MKFFWDKKTLLSFPTVVRRTESSVSQKNRILSLSEISQLDSVFLKTLPQNIRELSALAKPLHAEGLIISQALIQDFWSNNGLAKKIKKIITPLSLHHPRAITEAAEAIQRLIIRQNLPESWQTDFKAIIKNIAKKSTKILHLALYLENSEIGSANWLPDLQAHLSEIELNKIIKQGLAALYSERFIRERLQRGWSQINLPITVAVTVAEETKATDSLVTIHTAHPAYHNSAIAQFKFKNKEQKSDYTIFKPSLSSKKALVLNDWSNSFLSEEILRTIIAPLVSLEQKNGYPIRVSGIFNQTNNTFTVLRLETDRTHDKEVLYDYILSNKSPVLLTGQFLGQGIAVGSLLVDRPGQALKISHSGNIIVAKKLANISVAILAEAAGFILEEEIDTAQIAAKANQINVPILAGVKNATKKFRSGTMVTVASTSAPEGVVYSGALPYEVKPIVRVKHHLKTEVRSARTAVTIDELIGQTQAEHPLAYFSLKNNRGELYTKLLGQALALSVAENYPARLTVAFSNNLPRVFTHWTGGKQAESALRLRNNARGAERYLAKQYAPVLAAECTALKKVREQFGFTEIDIQLPYCRSSVELEELILAIGKHGLTREQGWRFSLATDLPGHAILTSALAKHLDELVFDLDSLVKSTTGTKSAITPAHQKTVEHALSAIAKAANKERTQIALSGNLLVTEPRLVWSAVKSGIKTLVVTDKDESFVRATAWEAERTIGYGGANSKMLGMVTSAACLGALLITVGGGCGKQDQVVTAPQMTPAQIRAEIVSALETQRENALNEETVATVVGFADFKVAHPRRFEASYSPKNFILANQTGEMLKFSAVNKFGTTSSTDFVTNSNLMVKLFTFVPKPDIADEAVTASSSTYIYEIELEKNKILKIESSASSEEIIKIIKSIQVI